MEEFKDIPRYNNKRKFIDEVEAESVRILRKYNLPTTIQRLSSETLIEKTEGTTILELLKKSPNKKYTDSIPLDIYQAKKILCLVGNARSAYHDLEVSKVEYPLSTTAAEIMSDSIEEIRRIISLQKLPQNICKGIGKANKDKKKKPRENRLFLKHLIEIVRQNHCDQEEPHSDGFISHLVDTANNYTGDKYTNVSAIEDINKAGNPEVTFHYDNSKGDQKYFTNSHKRLKAIIGGH